MPEARPAAKTQRRGSQTAALSEEKRPGESESDSGDEAPGFEPTRVRIGPKFDSPGGPRPPTKTSIGIILCRTNTTSGRPEVLLVHKRYTYAFAEFVHGRYARGRIGTNAALRAVSALLSQMTTEELLDVWSLNFDQMWFRIWLTRERRDLYAKKCGKFHSTFLRDDKGNGLLRAVQAARAQGTLLWEVPKGRRLTPREPDAICAVRELREETGIEKNEYRILPGVKRRVSYVSGGTRYVCVYYVAVANQRLAVRPEAPGTPGDPSRPTLRDVRLMGEVSEVRWHDIERVRLLDGRDARLESLVAPAFRLMKQYLKGRWAARSQAPPSPSGALVEPGLTAAAEPGLIGLGLPGEEAGWKRVRRGHHRAPAGATARGRRRGPRAGKQGRGRASDEDRGGASSWRRETKNGEP